MRPSRLVLTFLLVLFARGVSRGARHHVAFGRPGDRRDRRRPAGRQRSRSPTKPPGLSYTAVTGEAWHVQLRGCWRPATIPSRRSLGFQTYTARHPREIRPQPTRGTPAWRLATSPRRSPSWAPRRSWQTHTSGNLGSSRRPEDGRSAAHRRHARPAQPAGPASRRLRGRSSRRQQPAAAASYVRTGAREPVVNFHARRISDIDNETERGRVELLAPAAPTPTRSPSSRC